MFSVGLSGLMWMVKVLPRCSNASRNGHWLRRKRQRLWREASGRRQKSFRAMFARVADPIILVRLSQVGRVV